MVARLAAADSLADGLATDDLHALDAAVTAIEKAPADPDALFAAGRACEDRLVDPARALAIYDRIVRELPSSRVAGAAEHRAAQLRPLVGDRGQHAREAAELARLIAEAGSSDPANGGKRSIDDIIARGDALAAIDWPGAPDAAVWLADWLRGAGRFDDARARYAAVIAKWPQAPQAQTALRGETGAAIDAHDWNAAEALVASISTVAPEDRVLRDELAGEIRQGRTRDRFYIVAWIAVGVVIAGLVASLIEASRRAGKRPPLVPPIEVMFLGPVAAVIVGVSITANRVIAPAVAMISIGGLVCAWLSGTTLDLVRASNRPIRARALGHVAGCLVAVAALVYIAMMRDGLLDLLIETVRVGPET
ncbi:MAG TPA: tetratricopeptide repeat protein [Kofleriaceae bacterium]|nr:tetratricopeptide repeat protein [Kofleriaceae bacterium]